MKKIIVSYFLVICIFILSLCNIMAEEKVETSNLDLETAIQIALSKNSELKYMDDKIVYASQRYQLTCAESAFAKAKDWETDVQLIANKKEEILYPQQRKNDITRLNLEKRNKIASIKLDVTKNYYQILNDETLIKLKQDIINNLSTELEIKKSQVDKGNDTRDAITNIELSIDQKVQELNSLKRDQDILKMKLNALLCEGFSNKIELKDGIIPYEKYQVADLNQVIEKQLLDNTEIKEANMDLEEAKTEYDIIKRYSNKINTNGIEEVEDKLLQIEYDMKQKRSDVELNIRTDYNNILNLADDVEISELELGKYKKLSETALSKYKLGKITIVEYDKVKSNEIDAQSTLNQAKINYFLAIEDFKLYL